MALLASEVARIKAELGYNTLTIGAEPYIGFVSLFDQVIQPYLSAGAATTSSTTVSAVASGAAASPVTLTLASATGFASLAQVAIDVDDRQEIATVQSVTGSTITVLLSKAHTGTYPVTVDGGEAIVRELLGQLRALSKPGGVLATAASSAGVKKVDEIEFFGGQTGSSALRDALRMQRHFRDELAAVLGVTNLRGSGAGGALSLY